MLLCTNWQGAPLPNAMSDVFFVAAMYYYLRQNEFVNREVSSRRAVAEHPPAGTCSRYCKCK
jgi:hypothetical protein